MYRGPFTYRRSSGGTLAFESAPFDRGRLTEAGTRYHVTDHLGSVRAVIDGNASTTNYPLTGFYTIDDFAPFGVKSTSSASLYLSLASTGSTVSLRDGFTGQEDQGPDFGVGYSDFGARQYSPVLSRWLVPDPMGEKYYDVSPYAYCKNNPIFRIDYYGMDDYRYDDQTGVFYLMELTDDKTDRVLGYHINKHTGEYEKNTKWYQTKIRMTGIEKGILKDGIDFMNNHNIIAVGGENEATVRGVEAFVVDLSDMVRKEIGGAYFSKDGASSTTHITIGSYKRNSYKSNNGGHGHMLWNRVFPDSDIKSSLTGFFHTHPSGPDISVSDRTRPSDQDKRSRDAALKMMPSLQFFILTHSIYHDDYPMIIPYTTWF